MSLKDNILKASDGKSESVIVPEWGETVTLRNMSGTERDSWELVAFKDGKVAPEAFRAKMLVRCIVDDTGARVFTDDDAAALSGKSALVLSRLYDVAAKLNGIGPGDTEELVKN